MRVSALLFLACAGLARGAELTSPEGDWKTIDERSGRQTGLVRIYAVGGEWRGRVIDVVPEPGGNPDPVCDRCPGAFRNKPVRGLEFMWGMRRRDAGWSDGRILDPDDGSVYRARMTLIDGGRRLSVRGYVGIPLLGRSQIWIRHAPDARQPRPPEK